MSKRWNQLYESIPKFVREWQKNQDNDRLLKAASIAKEFRTSVAMVLEVAEAHPEMDVMVGVRTFSGHFLFETKGDYEIEWFGEP